MNSQQTTITLTIKEEMFGGTACWVARDQRGHWRSCCEKHLAATPGDAVAMMFHPFQVKNVAVKTSELASVEVYQDPDLA